MNQHLHRTRRLTAVTGLAVLAIVATMNGADAVGPATGATVVGTTTSGTIHRVALHNGDDRQAPDKSSTSGSTTVASADGRFVVFSTEAPLVRHDRNRLDDVYLRDTVKGSTRLISVTRAGVVGNDYSVEPTISSSGRYVAFTTWATNLFRDRNGGTLDVVVKDLNTGRIRLVSRTRDGHQVRRNSFSPVISGNGRHVAFQTFGSFAKTDADRREDVYVHDRRTGSIRQVSLDAAGKDLPGHYLVGGITGDGRKVTFGDDNNAWVRDMEERRTVRFWHEPNHPDSPFPAGTVGRPVISGDGRFVAFSTRSELVVDRDAGFYSDIFRLNLATGRFEMVSVGMDGALADEESFIPSLSRTGRYVGFSSFAGNLVPGDTVGGDTFVRDMRTGTTTIASAGPGGPGNSDSGRNSVAISANGRTLVYESYASDLVAGDTNRRPEVFAWRAAG